jgi:pimeloyl-ACP methyl ester carboxylesterase
MLTEKRFDAGRVTIHYVEGSAVGVPLVLLHGATGRWQSFLPVLPLFACRYHIYALDLRGHGRSDHANSVYEIEEYGDDVIRFLRARVGGPAVLVGHSMGAEVAQWIAAAVPERIRGVVMEEPGLYTISEGRFPQHPIYQRLHAVYALLISQPSIDDIVSLLRTLLPEADEVGRRAWATSLHQLDPAVLAHILDGRAMARIRHDELLPQISAPVLLLQGNPALEGMFTEQDVARASALLHDCIHIYRPDLGHDFHSMAPLAFFQLVCGFVECLPRGMDSSPASPAAAIARSI